MKNSIYLLPSIMFCLTLTLCAADNEQAVSDNQQKKDKSSSIIYNLYDSSANGLKGALFAGVATPCSVGVYAPYSIVRFGDILFKRFMLCISSAEQFGNKPREKLEKETALRELTNRFAKANVSTGMVAVALAIAMHP